MATARKKPVATRKKAIRHKPDRARLKLKCIEAAALVDNTYAVAKTLDMQHTTLYRWLRDDDDFRAKFEEALVGGRDAVHAERLELARQLTTGMRPIVEEHEVWERDDKGELVMVSKRVKRSIDTTVLLRGLAKHDAAWRNQLVTVGSAAAGEPLDARLQRIADEDAAAKDTKTKEAGDDHT